MMTFNNTGGDGDGSGSGYGDGYGYGSGDGYGYGYGYGYGCTVGSIGGYDVRVLSPWAYVQVGCECHSTERWRQNWKEVVKQYSVLISDLEVEDLLCKTSLYAVE